MQRKAKRVFQCHHYSEKKGTRCRSKGSLLAVTATGGQRHESTEFENLIANCDLSLHRYDRRPNAMAGDKGYSAGAIRESIQERAVESIP
ncbi:hypothetical protein Poly51_20240 [Rubripirellula tenax]|uniref:Transposase DDE domain protein n=1 Tax=Rubripirellula tenax TaxID=2528015 RepID=A0A5C6FCQ3_9BACT|nr:hypothetical protein Poly51_20240 [Rubripirellula tenax]